MLLRRLYSSLPARVASSSSAAAAPKPARAATRGRTRPMRVKIAHTHLKEAAPTEPTRGRRLRRGSFHPRTDLVSSEIPKPTAPGFQPVTLYPAHVGLHMSFTPSHMPLPVNLGHAGYLSREVAEAVTSGPLFQPRTAPSPLAGLRAAPTSLGEHLNLTRALSHPSLAHHLGNESATSLAAIDINADSRLSSLLDSAAANHADAAWGEWESALQRLGAAPQVAEERSLAEQSSIDDAVAGVNGLLARLQSVQIDSEVVAVAGTEVSDEVVHMDSVKRKRKKKMNKHKYKKRRKATRAERRRLGK